MKNQILQLLRAGVEPVVRVNEAIRSYLDWDGYLAPGMLAKVVGLEAAPGWVQGMDVLRLAHADFSWHNEALADEIAMRVRNDPASWAECSVAEELFLLDGTSFDFISLLEVAQNAQL